MSSKGPGPGRRGHQQRESRLLLFWRTYRKEVVGGLLLPLVVLVISLIVQRSPDKEPPKSKPSVEIDRPSVVVMTQATYLRERGIPTGDTPPSDLRRRGAAVRANVRIRGYDGETLPVTCTIHDATARRTLPSDQTVNITAEGESQLTTPCWIALPDTDGRHRFKAEVRIQAPDGSAADLATSSTYEFSVEG